MSATTYGLVLVFLAAGASLGWYANRAIASNADVKSTKKKLPGFRKSRKHNGVIALILTGVIIVVVFDLIHVRH